MEMLRKVGSGENSGVLEMTRTRKIVFILVAVLLIGLYFGLNYLQSVKEYQQEVKEITFSDIDISSIPDGNYLGECDVNFISAKVKVVVQDGRMTEIYLLEHKNDRGSAAEVIIKMMLEQQKVDVDAVSSATNSSNVIKKAVDNALAADQEKT